MGNSAHTLQSSHSVHANSLSSAATKTRADRTTKKQRGRPEVELTGHVIGKFAVTPEVITSLAALFLSTQETDDSEGEQQ